MEYYSRRLVKVEDLNPARRLFGGKLLAWIDEEAATFTVWKTGTHGLVTKFMSEINFVSPGHLGDIIEFGMEMIRVGSSSITVRCEVRNLMTKQVIIRVDQIVFVCVDEEGNAQCHGIDPASLGVTPA